VRGSAVRKDVFEYAVGGFKSEKIREEPLDYCVILRNIELRIEK
jgi:hypothetical protein